MRRRRIFRGRRRRHGRGRSVGTVHGTAPLRRIEMRIFVEDKVFLIELRRVVRIENIETRRLCVATYGRRSGLRGLCGRARGGIDEGFRRFAPLRLSAFEIVERNRAGIVARAFGFRMRGVFAARRMTQIVPQARCGKAIKERAEQQERENNIRPRLGKQITHGEGDDSEQHAAARSAACAVLGGVPAPRKVSAVTSRNETLGCRRMYDKEHGKHNEQPLYEPARGNKLFARDKRKRQIRDENQKRIDEKSEQPHEKRGDRRADIAEYKFPRNGNQKYDYAEEKQGHADRLSRHHAEFAFFFFLTASQSVQNTPSAFTVYLSILSPISITNSAEIFNDIQIKILIFSKQTFFGKKAPV